MPPETPPEPQMDAEDAGAICAQDYGANLSTWNAHVRRARLADPKKKLAALVFGSYANADGTSIKCGVSRFAADCEMAYSTARRYLAWLREVGLIELVRAGNRKAKRADEYRLTISPASYAGLEIPDEAAYRDLIEGVSASNRAGEKGRRLRSGKASAEATGSEEPAAPPSALTPRESAETAICAQLDGFLRSPMSELPPSINTFQEQAPSTGGAPPPDPRRPEPPSGSRINSATSLAVVLTPAQDQQGGSLPHASTREAAPVVELFPGVLGEAPYRPAGRWNTRRDAIADSIAEAAARRAKAREEHQARLAAEKGAS